MTIPQTRVFRYGVALALVGAALGLSLAFEPFLHHGFLIFFLSAAMLAGWFGRTGPGLLAVAFSMVLVDYYFIAPHRAFMVEVDELPYLLAFLDRVQLQQVLLNLLINSFDALSGITDRRRQVKIKSEWCRESVVIQVEDSGNGWGATHGKSIFDPFFTTKKDGIGMGLTISRSIVEGHGGRLWAEQLKPYGTVLNFTLPMLAGVD